MLERRTQAIMDRLDSLLGNTSESRNRGAHSREERRDPRRVNFNEQPDKGRTYGSTRGRGNSNCNATRNSRPRNPTNIRGTSFGSLPISNKRPTRDAHASRKSDSRNWNHSNQGEELSPTTRTGGKFCSLKQQIWTVKCDIHGIQQQWPWRLKI